MLSRGSLLHEEGLKLAREVNLGLWIEVRFGSIANTLS